MVVVVVVVVVVEYYTIYIYIIVEPPDLRHPLVSIVFIFKNDFKPSLGGPVKSAFLLFFSFCLSKLSLSYVGYPS